ncbi:hypothetical protein ACT538_17975, partial [Leptospira kirschneri]|uniref:hypothetical protein n=1 Tax=Leptospira kirschneri TaxID=29507 RepID=UPI003690C52D
FENCGNYYKIQKESSSIRFSAQNCCFAAIIKIKIRFNVSAVEEDFSKSMSSYILEFVFRIVICGSSHIILQTNLSFVIVPTLEILQVINFYFLNCESSYILEIDL